jgi:signal transduction histidine kinase
MSITQIAPKRSITAEPAVGDSASEIQADIAAVASLEFVPKLLDIICTVTGMRFAAVARVTDKTWTTCAVKDDINFGLLPGSQLDVNTTLCIEVRAAGEPIVIDHASAHPKYCGHATPRTYKIESYISVPIMMQSGRYFGNLCAIDPAPARISEPRTLALFEGFADLIAVQLENELQRRQVQRALKNERELSELREQFIGILGHDLRNPIQAILAGGELLETKYSADAGVAGVGARIKRSARRMSALIDDVLDFTRGRLGSGIDVQISAVDDIEGALTDVVEELQDGKPDRQIVLDVDVTRVVRCDLRRFQQVASNLIGNALTHGNPKAPVRVSVTADHDELFLSVWNDGEPIPSDVIHKIFDPFWRRDTANTRQGLGLGLHISSQIVAAHGGTLSVSSASDSGTEFIARFPMQRHTPAAPSA